MLTCLPPNFVGFNGFNFGPSFGHGCTAVVLNNTNGVFAEPINVYNNKFLNDGNCTGLANNQRLYLQQGNSTGPENISSNTFDGNVNNFPDLFGACAQSPAGGAECNIQSAFMVRGPITMTNNSISNFMTSAALLFNTTPGSMTFRGNFANRWNVRDGRLPSRVCGP